MAGFASKYKYWILAAAVLAAGFFLFRASGLGAWLDQRGVVHWFVASARENKWAFLLFAAVIAVGNQLLVPINLLLLAVALALPGWKGFFCGMLGAVLAAMLQAMVGRWIGESAVRKRLGERFGAIADEVAENGVTAVVTLSLVPIAPNVVTNLVAGACRVPMWKLVVGTVIGFLPGLVLLNLLGREMRRFLQEPSYTAALASLGLVGVLFLSSRVSRRLKERRRTSRPLQRA